MRGENHGADSEGMFGLVSSPHRDVALREMRRLMNDPDHPVSSSFVYTLTLLRRGGDLTIETRAAEDAKNREAVRGELLEAVSRKRGRALALTLNTVLEVGNNGTEKPQHVGDEMAARIAAIFDQLPADKQAQLIAYRWETIKGPAFLPVLRKYARRYQEFTVPNEMNAHTSLSLSGAALQHWYEFDPDEARPVVIQEIVRPRPRYGARVLGMLPEATLPEAEPALAAHFAAEPKSYAAENVASLLHRYVTNAVVPQVLPVVDRHIGKWACAIQVPILAYLLRVDPAAARPRIEAAIAARGAEFSACNHSLLVELGALQQNSLLEEVAIPSLNDDEPEVAASAATFLGRYGSAAAEEKLWERLTRWSEEWRGREEKFRYLPGENNPHLEQGSLGQNLIQALATGRSWLADAGKLRRLRQLALGADMRQRVETMLTGWEKGRPTITYHRGGDRPYFRVLQYEANSLESFQEKLAQFPPGAEFNWGGVAVPDEDEQIRQELSRFLESRGMKLSAPQN